MHSAPLLHTIFVLLVHAHGHVHIQNVRDFHQTELDCETFSFPLKRAQWSPFFFQVFANNSLIKNIFEEWKKFDNGTPVFGKIVPNGCILAKVGTSSYPRNCPKKCNIPATKQSKTAYSKWSNTAYVNKWS